ncbi:polyhydroxyalkanoate synthesis repressor PhaR [Lichenifustis flavocetrariae]|uniref:Polyhydroxyalkanoate synthesis repressor PhaR n=1 Tax=Lichenifustis flavocetrariae TaxID=2949735 RepID=A0AA41YVY2_9HYPH|nr:polyhydroxyalkanoate synthesis repressor PhaR [Lichenifustis flavocetrariae]MCW6507963.1 polyhydroxyalkanoate synthesis repressor PhaR [Lichenifustis flavocetrariae]
MSVGDTPVTIKKYANRRLYNTGTSTYVTLEDLAVMVKKGDDFVVFDAKTGEEITRSVLAQIIFEQEGKTGQSLLPITFLRQLIRFYGNSMQMLVPSYLEFTIDRLTSEQHKLRDQMDTTFGTKFLPGQAVRNQMFDQLEEQTRKNMLMFSQALSVFNPFAAATPGTPAPAEAGGESEPAVPEEDDIETVRRDMVDLQKRLDRLASKP